MKNENNKIKKILLHFVIIPIILAALMFILGSKLWALASFAYVLLLMVYFAMKTQYMLIEKQSAVSNS